MVDAAGDKDLRAYTKGDATTFRDALIERGLSGSSITRIFGTVRAVTNFAASEMGVSLTNPFSGVYVDREAGVQERVPVARVGQVDVFVAQSLMRQNYGLVHGHEA